MSKPIVLLLVWGVVGAGLASVSAAEANAAGLAPAVADCDLHAQLTRHYSIEELRLALDSIPAEISEYTNCHDVIQHQLLLQLGQIHGGSGAGGGGGGSFLPTWLIVLLGVMALGAAGLGTLAWRQRRTG